LEEETTLTIS